MLATRNLYSTTPGDLTTGTTTTGTGSVVDVQQSGPVSVQMTLVGGTSATGHLEGSVDGTHFASVQSTDFNLAAPGTATVTVTSAFPFLRFNTLTNVGGGTVYAFLAL